MQTRTVVIIIRPVESHPNVTPASYAEVQHMGESAHRQVGGDAVGYCTPSRSVEPQPLPSTSGSWTYQTINEQGEVGTHSTTLLPFSQLEDGEGQTSRSNPVVAGVCCSSPQPCQEEGSTADTNSVIEEDQSDFLKLANYVHSQFEEAKGSTPSFQEKTLGPGQEDFVARKRKHSLFPFRWSDPMTQARDHVDRMVTKKISSGRSPLLPFSLAGRSFYKTDEDYLNCGASAVNSSLARLLPKNPSEARPSINSRDLIQLEEAFKYLRSVQNFQFWIFGAISRLFKMSDTVPDRDLLMNKAVYSMELAMQRASQVSTTVLSNILTIRRQSILNTLPSSFSSTVKHELLQSPLASSLFVEKIEQVRLEPESYATRKLQ